MTTMTMTMAPQETFAFAREMPGAADETYLPGDGIPGMVSVVIPTYNRADVVHIAIDSVLRQTWKNYEIIVVDDGSKDHTRQVVEAYGEPVRYIHQPNAGVSTARNTGFRAARGEFVALLDSDDAFAPWKLEAQVAVLRAYPDAGMIWSDMSAVDTATGVVKQRRYLRTYYDAHDKAQLEQVFPPPVTLGSICPGVPAQAAADPVYVGDVFSQLLLGNLVHTSTVVLRRSRLREVGLFDLSLVFCGEDYEFHMRTCAFGPVAFMDTPALDYYVGADDQLTGRKYGIYRARHNLVAVDRWMEYGRGRITLSPELIRWRYAQAHGWLGEWEIDFGELAVARHHLLKSIRLGTRDLRVYRMFFVTLLPPSVREGMRRLKRGLRAKLIGAAPRNQHG